MWIHGIKSEEKTFEDSLNHVTLFIGTFKAGSRQVKIVGETGEHLTLPDDSATIS